jgi:hypothetical protein
MALVLKTSDCNRSVGSNPTVPAIISKAMKKLFLFLLLFVSLNVFACDTYIFGFRGANRMFDEKVFIEYAHHHNMCWHIFNAEQNRQVVKLIGQINRPYELYGFSLGAESIRAVLKEVQFKKMRKPNHVITIGAFRTTNVNFEKYGVSFINYFDESGKGQKSPGIHISGVPHNQIQKVVDSRIR